MTEPTVSIVIDDGSTAATGAIASAYERDARVRHVQQAESGAVSPRRTYAWGSA